MDGASADAANHAGAAALGLVAGIRPGCARLTPETREAGPGKARQNVARPRGGPFAALRRQEAAPGAARHEEPAPEVRKPLVGPGCRRRVEAPPEGNPVNFQEPQRTVSRLRCRTWFPRSGIRMRPSGFPPEAGLHTGRRDRRPFAYACQVSAEAQITRTPGKMAAPCTGGAASAPPIRNSLSVQEARRCAAARHSAFSRAARAHPPDQGPET